MRVFKRIGERLAERREAGRRISEDYVRAYRRCFEAAQTLPGDWMHGITCTASPGNLRHGIDQEGGD